jgi:hypothetical protein
MMTCSCTLLVKNIRNQTLNKIMTTLLKQVDNYKQLPNLKEITLWSEISRMLMKMNTINIMSSKSKTIKSIRAKHIIVPLILITITKLEVLEAQ